MEKVMDWNLAEPSPSANGAPGTAGRAPAPTPNLGLRALLAASVALPTFAVAAKPAWAQLGTSSNVPRQDVFGTRPDAGAPATAPNAPADVPGTPIRATAAPAPAVVIPSAPGVAGETPTDAVRILLEQASYWRSQYQPDKAIDSLDRILRVEPDNADALFMLGQIQAERGDAQAAQATLARLRKAKPDDPRIAALETSIRSGKIDETLLADARALSQQGKQTEAIAKYKAAFNGDTPPTSLAAEYYQTLGGTPGGFDAAREGLGREVINNPQDLRLQLAYAQLLTYRETTRDEGIQRLNLLAQNPAVHEQAEQSLRQALLWLPTSPDSVPQITVYLQRNPTDTQLKEKLELAKNPPQTPIDQAGQARVAGYERMQNGNITEAEKEFQRALEINPKDGDATAGLGIVRLRQGKRKDARTLLASAVEFGVSDPESVQALIRSIDNPPNYGGGGRGNYAGDGGAAIRRQYAQVARFANDGRYDQAEALLRKLMGRRGNWGNYLQLGDIQARAGKLAEAEANFRRAMELNPRNSAATVGLAGLLIRQGRNAEAEALYTRINDAAGKRELGRLRAQQLRQQAEGIDDPVAQAGLYRQAAIADPTNPWLRLELAQALRKQGRAAEAQAVMTDVANSPNPSNDAIQAALIYAQQADDLALANQLVVRIPERARTPEIRQLESRLTLQNEINQITRGGNPAEARGQLLALAAQPDPTGTRGAEIARALTRLDDREGARDAVIASLANTQAPSAQQRLAYSGALLEAGFDQDAEVVVASIDPTRLPADQRPALDGIADGLAIRQAEKLRAAGRTADAYEELAPRLAANPENPGLNMALGRLYQTNQDPRQAMAINEALLSRNPNNLDVRRSLVGAAIAAGDYGRADQIAEESAQIYPNDPRTYVMSADLARARGNNGRALRDLRTARELRLQQLGVPDLQQRSDAADVLRPERTAVADASPAVPGPKQVTVSQSARRPVLAGFGSNGAQSGSMARPLTSLGALASAGAQEQADAKVQMVPNAPYKAELAQASLPLAPAPFQSPFRRAGTGPSQVDLQPVTPGITGQTGIGRAELPVDSPRQRPLLPEDQLLASIDRDIAVLRQEVAPTVQVGLGIRGRSGQDGLGRLTEFTVPMEAQFSPAGVGRLTVQVTPTYLDGNRLSVENAAQFGSNPLIPVVNLLRANLPTPLPALVASTPNQTAEGVGLNVGYAYRFATVDIGTTPLGFRQENIVGGIGLAPVIAPNLRLRALGERRAVTDSVLSYAGARDPGTGITFGGVTRKRGYLGLEYTPGLLYLFAGGAGGVAEGKNVASNTFYELTAGGSYPIYRTPTRELRAGLNLSYINYEKNLGGFTIGQGGYFSPQNYFAAVVPITWREQVNERLRYQLGASIGIQTFNSRSTPLFPTSPGDQALLNLTTRTTGVPTTNFGGNTTGFAGGVSGEIDYKLTRNIRVGARAGYQRAGDFNEGSGLVYARYLFDGDS